MIKANFNAYNSYVTDSLYQWDKDQTLRVSGINIAVAPEIHFTNIEMDRAIVRQGELKDGIISVKIPNSLLQSIQDIKVYIGVWEGSTFTTIETVVIPVIMRNKPEDYVLEVNDEEYYSFSRLENEIANMVTLAGFNAQVAKTEAEIKTKEEALKAQIANIIAHNNDTEGNTELLDIRTGADGTVYPSAGDAVRGQVSDLKGDLAEYTIDGYYALSGELSSRYFTKSGEGTRTNSVMKYTLPSDVKYIAVDMLILANVYYIAFTDALDNILNVCISTVGFDNKKIRNIAVPSGATTLWLTNNSTNVGNIKAYGKKTDNLLYSTEIANYVGFIKTDGSVSVNNQYRHTRKINIEDAESITVTAVYNEYIATVAFYDENGIFIGHISPTNQNDTAIVCIFEIEKSEFPIGAKYASISVRSDFSYKSAVCVKYNKLQNNPVLDLKYMCFGDSVTSDEVTGTGTKICDELGAYMLGNFAHGNATCQDYKSLDGSSDISPETPNVTYKVVGGTANQEPANVLSNQIRRALCYSTPSNETVTYKHPRAGNQALDNNIWRGTGSAENIPDVIYIAIGINDGAGWTDSDGTTYRPTATNSQGDQADDSESVYTKTYTELNRIGFANALRWAIETLQCAYPKAQIFVASPLQTQNVDWRYHSYANTKMKRDITKKMCEFCSVHFIDAFGESGFSTMVASDSANGDGTHPSIVWANNNARFVANEIKRRYSTRK